MCIPIVSDLCWPSFIHLLFLIKWQHDRSQWIQNKLFTVFFAHHAMTSPFIYIHFLSSALTWKVHYDFVVFCLCQKEDEMKKINFLFSFFLQILSTRARHWGSHHTKMWSSRKGPTTRLWDFIVVTLVLTLNFKVSLSAVYI